MKFEFGGPSNFTIRQLSTTIKNLKIKKKEIVINYVYCKDHLGNHLMYKLLCVLCIL